MAGRDPVPEALSDRRVVSCDTSSACLQWFLTLMTLGRLSSDLSKQKPDWVFKSVTDRSTSSMHYATDTDCERDE